MVSPANQISEQNLPQLLLTLESPHKEEREMASMILKEANTV